MKQINTEYPVPLLSSPIGMGDTERNTEFITDEGIQSSMCVPTESGGVRFNRHHMNGISYAASIGTFLHQMGYPTGEMRRETAEKIGGFPKGAILSFIDDNGYYIEYQSKVDDNMADFPSYDGNNLVEDDYWKPVITTRQYYGIPDYTNILAEKEFTGISNANGTYELTVPDDSVVVVKINTTSSSVNSSRGWLYFYGFPTFDVYSKGSSNVSVNIGRLQLTGEGGTAIQNYMLGAGNTIGVKINGFNSSLIGSINIFLVAYGVTGTLQ